MQAAYRTLNSLGWLWRENGVEITVVLDGRPMRVFIPLGRVVVTFNAELAREGFAEPPSVGDHSCVGFFGKIGRAFSSIGKGAARAVKRAASSVTRTAGRWGAAALKGAGKLAQSPYLRAGLAAASLAMPALAPAAVALETANRAYGAAQQARQFVQRPTMGRALGLAAQAAPMAAQRSPFGGFLRGAAPVARSPFGGFLRGAAPLQQRARRANLFARALGVRF